MSLNGPYALCGARSKQNDHRPCRQPAIRNKKRCRLHGGLSTGPKTVEGRNRCAEVKFKHGMYAKAAGREKMAMRMMMQWKKDLYEGNQSAHSNEL
jgi:hypothetical protein